MQDNARATLPEGILRATLPEVPSIADKIQGASSIADKIQGCLLMGLAGDVVGSQVEGKTSKEISNQYGFVTSVQNPRYTDDSELTFGVLNYLKKNRYSLYSVDPRNVMDEYCSVFDTRRGYSGSTRQILGWLKEHPRLEWPSDEKVLPKSTHNGSVMRIAPLGCVVGAGLGVGYVDHTTLTTAIKNFLFYTHNSNDAVAACFFHCITINYLLYASLITNERGVLELLEFLHKMSRENYTGSTSMERVIRIVKGCYLKNKFSQGASITEKLTEGTEDTFQIKALDAWGCALYSFCISYSDPVFTIANAISLGGDTDTIAKMAGELAGAAFGTSVLRENYEWCEGYEAMKKEASDLCTFLNL